MQAVNRTLVHQATSSREEFAKIDARKTLEQDEALADESNDDLPPSWPKSHSVWLADSIDSIEVELLGEQITVWSYEGPRTSDAGVTGAPHERRLIVGHINHTKEATIAACLRIIALCQ